MKRISLLAILLVATAACPLLQAQGHDSTAAITGVHLAIAGAGQSGGALPAYCTTAAPCADVTWSNGTDITEAITTSSSGVEAAGPATATVWRCTITSTQACASGSSGWSAVAVTNGQSLAETSSSGGPFYDPTVSYGQTYSYSVTLTWNGALGGVASTFAAPFQMAMPSAPAAAPAAPAGVGAVLVE